MLSLGGPLSILERGLGAEGAAGVRRWRWQASSWCLLLALSRRFRSGGLVVYHCSRAARPCSRLPTSELSRSAGTACDPRTWRLRCRARTLLSGRRGFRRSRDAPSSSPFRAPACRERTRPSPSSRELARRTRTGSSVYSTRGESSVAREWLSGLFVSPCCRLRWEQGWVHTYLQQGFKRPGLLSPGLIGIVIAQALVFHLVLITV